MGDLAEQIYSQMVATATPPQTEAQLEALALRALTAEVAYQKSARAFISS